MVVRVSWFKALLGLNLRRRTFPILRANPTSPRLVENHKTGPVWLGDLVAEPDRFFHSSLCDQVYDDDDDVDGDDDDDGGVYAKFMSEARAVRD